MVSINDENDQKKRLTYERPRKAEWVYLFVNMWVTSVLIIHLKAFRLANINNKPEADV